MRTLLAVSLLGSLLSSPVNALVMTFDGDTPGYGEGPLTYIEDGISAVTESRRDSYFFTPMLFDSGNNEPSGLIFGLTTGGLFSAVEFEIVRSFYAADTFARAACEDIQLLEGCYAASFVDMRIEGFRNGETVARFDIDSAENLGLVQLGSSFSLLSSLRISVISPFFDGPIFSPEGDQIVCFTAPCTAFEIDNVVLEPVPLPAAMILGLSGIAMIFSIGAFSRNRHPSAV